MFELFKTELYQEDFNKLDNNEKQRVISLEHLIVQNPFSGKPLGYEFLREKKFCGKRIIFLVYEKHLALYLICIVDKKVQQAEINIIKANLPFYKMEFEKRIKPF